MAIVLLTALILGACSGVEQEVTPPEKLAFPDFDLRQSGRPGKTGRPVSDKTADNTGSDRKANRSAHAADNEAPYDTKPRPIAYELVSDPLPAEVESLIEENREKTGCFNRKIDDAWYVTALMGEQKTDGYDLSITAVEVMNGETLIRVTEICPSEDEMVLMAPTYPFRVVRIRDDAAADFKVINQDGDIYPELEVQEQ